jgi:hypothetical protein
VRVSIEGRNILRTISNARTERGTVNRSTGLVSPQFHVTLDPSFRTVKEDKYDQLWKVKAGFLASRKDDVSGGKHQRSQFT